VDFVRDVRPILEQHCYGCHGPEKQKGGFRLDIKQSAFHEGDEHAPNLIAGSSEKSPLYRFVSGTDPKLQMPPKNAPGGNMLKAEQLSTLRAWIDEGAVWPDGVDLVKAVDKLDWWSWKPLERPQVPDLPEGKFVIENEIDAFVAAKLVEKGLPQSGEADARTLIRRLTFDLHGLPPTPEEVSAFEKAAATNKLAALEQLVDRLLDSPRYGERWARHWLDLVHYGETHGYDKDKPRPNAWPYRDYVIRAFNEDKPYARFVREQIAGDVLYPGTTDGMVALGFIAAGPWDLIGHTELPESKTDGMIARHLDRDDIVQNVMGAFNSLTVGCAQCHNHKFDPVSQQDYYSLQAVFSALDRTDVKYYEEPLLMETFHRLQVQKKDVTAALAPLEGALKSKAGEPYKALTSRIEGASKNVPANPGNARPDYGYHSAISSAQEVEKWVQVDLGQSTRIGRVRLLPCFDDYNAIGAGFGFPVRFKIEASDDPEFHKNVTLFWKRHDETFMNDFPNPGLKPFQVEGSGVDEIKWRYVRVTAVKLAPRENDFIFSLAEIHVFDDKGKNVALGAAVTALDSIEAPPRWRKVNLTDGIAPAAPTTEEKDALLAEREQLLRKQADADTLAELDRLRAESANVESQLRKLPPPSKVYAGSIHYGSGAFTGTGPMGGNPRIIRLLKRGEVQSPADEVAPGTITALSVLRGQPGRFKLVNSSDEGERRADLAQWITDKGNPLTWRSIVNRVWQHHMGRPLVDTPNDFGRMGGLPTNPALLDWMAATFRDDFQGSFKKLHKVIVMSHTYRQTSSLNGHDVSSDADNQFFSHQNRRKLDAEAVRDSILLVSGKMDFKMGGPGYQDFIIEKPDHSPHYLYGLHDPEDPASHRRSVYRFIVRSQQQPFMTALDCADPSMRIDKRNESLSPLQALAMMNNGLTVTMAAHFAERVRSEGGDLNAQVKRAFVLAMARVPSAEELTALSQYAAKEGLQNTCRLIMNLNEFSFVD